MFDAKADRLHDMLGSLHDYSLIPSAAFIASPGTLSLGAAATIRHDGVGAHLVDAALAAGGQPTSGSDPAPAAAMPARPGRVAIQVIPPDQRNTLG